MRTACRGSRGGLSAVSRTLYWSGWDGPRCDDDQLCYLRARSHNPLSLHHGRASLATPGSLCDEHSYPRLTRSPSGHVFLVTETWGGEQRGQLGVLALPHTQVGHMSLHGPITGSKSRGCVHRQKRRGVHLPRARKEKGAAQSAQRPVTLARAENPLGPPVSYGKTHRSGTCHRRRDPEGPCSPATFLLIASRALCHRKQLPRCQEPGLSEQRRCENTFPTRPPGHSCVGRPTSVGNRRPPHTGVSESRPLPSVLLLCRACTRHLSVKLATAHQRVPPSPRGMRGPAPPGPQPIVWKQLCS